MDVVVLVSFVIDISTLVVVVVVSLELTSFVVVLTIVMYVEIFDGGVVTS